MENIKYCKMKTDYHQLGLSEGDMVAIKTDPNGNVVIGPQLNEFEPGKVFLKYTDDTYKLISVNLIILPE